MGEVREFELGAILSMTTGHSCVDEFGKVFELVWFVCDDPFINSMGIGMVGEDVKKHLLTIHPELRSVIFRRGQNVEKFMRVQEEKFGKYLPVTREGEKLPKEYNESKKLVKTKQINGR